MMVTSKVFIDAKSSFKALCIAKREGKKKGDLMLGPQLSSHARFATIDFNVTSRRGRLRCLH
jgi:hypothetical protein